MTDFTPGRRASLEALSCEPLPGTPFVTQDADGLDPPLAAARVALVSTAGLMLRGERTVPANDTRYRAIPHAAADADVLMSHVSVSFDRSGFARDVEVVLPRRRLDALVAAGELGSAATRHFSFMGATSPQQMVRHAEKAAAAMREDGVTHVIGLPV